MPGCRQPRGQEGDKGSPAQWGDPLTPPPPAVNAKEGFSPAEPGATSTPPPPLPLAANVPPPPWFLNPLVSATQLFTGAAQGDCLHQGHREKQDGTKPCAGRMELAPTSAPQQTYRSGAGVRPPGAERDAVVHRPLLFRAHPQFPRRTTTLAACSSLPSVSASFQPLKNRNPEQNATSGLPGEAPRLPAATALQSCSSPAAASAETSAR